MKQHRFKKLTALILSVVMLLSLIPVTAMGDAGEGQDDISLANTGETNLYEGSDQAVTYDDNGNHETQTEPLQNYEIAQVGDDSLNITGKHENNALWEAGETYNATVMAGGANSVNIVSYADTSLFQAISLKDPTEVFFLREGADAQYCIDGKFMYDPLINNDPTFVVTLTEYGKTALGKSSDTVEMTASDIYDLGSSFMLNDRDKETVMNYQVGQSYEYVTYLDGTLPCTLPVTVVEETQVKSVSCLTNPVLLIENYDFDTEYGCSADQALWDGRVQFKVELNNGNSFSGSYNDIWNWLGFGPICDWSSNLAGGECTVGTTHQFVLLLGDTSAQGGSTCVNRMLRMREAADGLLYGRIVPR